MKFLVSVVIPLVFFGCASTAVQSPRLRPDQALWLPNRHTLTPSGTTIPIGSLPLGLSLSPDKKNILVVSSGFGNHTLSLVNVQQQRVVQTLLIRKSWMGSVWGPYNDYFFVTAGNDNKVYRYGVENDSAWFINSIPLGKPAPEEFISPSGITINSEGNTIFTVSRIANTLFKLQANENQIEQTLQYDNPLYTCLLDESRRFLYVSEWGAGRISIVHVDQMTKVMGIPVGNHPSAMALNYSQSHLYVTNSGENTISVINLSTMRVEETIDVGLRPNSLIGSTPNAISFSGDSLLFVALADNNALAVVDVQTIGKSKVRGFIPTAWYPTAVVVVDSTIIVANGKGNSSFPNPGNQSSAELIQGTLSFIPMPDTAQLHKYTKQVFENNPFTRSISFDDWNDENPIPRNSATVSPLKHVFFIVKDLRSYDQIFGDLSQGTGADSLALYGKELTPNHHALAEEYVLLDNFYADGQVTPDGMNYLFSGYANDYVMKTWPTLYSRRGGEYNYEQDGMASSAAGYLWDAARAKGLRVRNYGLFIDETASERGEIIPMVQGLAAITSPTYRGWDLYYYDTLRAEMWMKEFSKLEESDTIPHLSLIRLPNDNTAGESKKHRSRKSYIADNDRALGKIVERITKSKIWKESVIFILESSAYGGADHKDAHRTIGLVVSPYVKRNFVDHTHYTTLSMLHTIERILGIPFMTQHDAGAMPMYRIFQQHPDTTTFQAKHISNSSHEF